MSKVFNIVRGSYKAVDMTNNILASIIKIDGIDLPTGGGALVSNFRVNDSEKNGIIQCFENKNHIYAFGHDPDQSGFSVTYIVFLGKACMRDSFSEGTALRDMVGAYNKLKISERKATVDMTVGSGLTVRGIVLSFDVSVFESELNAITVTVAGKSMEML